MIYPYETVKLPRLFASTEQHQRHRFSASPRLEAALVHARRQVPSIQREAVRSRIEKRVGENADPSAQRVVKRKDDARAFLQRNAQLRVRGKWIRIGREEQRFRAWRRVGGDGGGLIGKHQLIRAAHGPDKQSARMRVVREADDVPVVQAFVGEAAPCLSVVERFEHAAAEVLQAGFAQIPGAIRSGIDHVRMFVVEGEKDVDTLKDLGIPATCNPMGAGKWKSGPI